MFRVDTIKCHPLFHLTSLSDHSGADGVLDGISNFTLIITLILILWCIVPLSFFFIQSNHSYQATSFAKEKSDKAGGLS